MSFIHSTIVGHFDPCTLNEQNRDHVPTAGSRCERRQLVSAAIAKWTGMIRSVFVSVAQLADNNPHPNPGRAGRALNFIVS